MLCQIPPHIVDDTFLVSAYPVKFRAYFSGTVTSIITRLSSIRHQAPGVKS